jgi:putative oxidoreductase
MLSGTIPIEAHEESMAPAGSDELDIARVAAQRGGGQSLADRWAEGAGDGLLLLGRLAIGVIFVESGFGKLMNLDGFAAGLAERGLPLAGALALIGAAVEFFAGLAAVIGFKTRYAALLLVAFTLAATLIAHRFWDFDDASARMQQIQFFKNVAITGGFLFLFVSGAGRFSLDSLLNKRQEP